MEVQNAAFRAGAAYQEGQLTYMNHVIQQLMGFKVAYPCSGQDWRMDVRGKGNQLIWVQNAGGRGIPGLRYWLDEFTGHVTRSFATKQMGIDWEEETLAGRVEYVTYYTSNSRQVKLYVCLHARILFPNQLAVPHHQEIYLFELDMHKFICALGIPRVTLYSSLKIQIASAGRRARGEQLETCGSPRQRV